MYLKINDQNVLFNMDATVISDLSDCMNLGMSFLKAQNCSLTFNKNQPIQLNSQEYGSLKSVNLITNMPANFEFYEENQSDFAQQLDIISPQAPVCQTPAQPVWKITFF